MPTIDSLEIQISAQVNKANTSVELLSKKLDRLSSSLSSANSRGLATLGAGVNKLANAMSNFSTNTKTADFSRLARNLTTISNIDTSKFSELSAKISQLSTAFGSVGTIDASGIANIGTSLSKLGGKNAIAGADNLIKVGDKLSQFVTQMNGIGSLTFDATNLSNLINSISRLGGKNATEVAKNLSPISAQLQNFVRQLNSIGSLTFDTANLSNLIAGITRLGGKAATSAAANIPKLATELSSLMTTLSKAPAINKNVIDMTNALANLARTGASSGRAANSLSQSFANISSTGNKTLGTLKGIQGSFRSLLRSILPFVGVFQLFSFGKQAIEISSDLTEVQNVVDTTFGDMAYKVESLAKTSIQQFGLSELSLKQFSSRFQAMGTAMGFPIEKMSDMSIELTKLTADMSSFYNVAQEDVAKNLQSIFTGETEPLRKYGLDLTQATLQEWALKQGIDANMQSMSQAEKTMLRYQYVMANTGAAQGDFADTAKTWANQTRILTQQLEQLASIVGGVLINAFKPLVQALNEAMSHIIAFAETVSNALGKIFGWKFEKGGGAGGIGGLVEDTEDLESGLGGAEKAAKKLNKQLRAFDELNLITTDTDGAGGAGGGTGGAGAGAEGQGGQWIQTESILQGYESSLDTLYKLGDYIGTKLSEAMESIRWEDVYEKARNFGSGLASFLNGLISPRLFGNVGTTIAGSLNTALHFLDSFGEEFDWKNFGESIAAGVNNFFSTFDFALLANTINTWANGLFDAVIEFLDDTEWEMIGEQIGTFLEELDFIEIGKKLGKSLWKAINAGIDIFKGMFKVAPIETTILGAIASIGLLGNAMAGIFSTLGEIISTVIIPFFAGLSAPIIAVVAAVSALVAGLGYVFATNEEVRQSFDNAVNSIKEGFQPAIEFVSETLLPDLNNGWDKLMEILSPLSDFLSGMFTSIWQDMINPALTYIGETVLPKVNETFSNLWNNVLVPLGNFLANVFAPVIQIVSDMLGVLWQNVVIPLANAVGGVLGKVWEGLADIFNVVIVPAINGVIVMFQFLWDFVLAPAIDWLWGTFKPIFENVFEVLGAIIETFGEVLGGLIDFIVGIFTGNWEKAWEGVKDIFKGIINGIASIFESTLNAIIEMLNFFLKKFNGIVTSFGDVIGIDISIPEVPKVKLPKLATGGIVYKPTYAEIGEAGKEGILPLTNRAAMSQLVDEIMISASGGGLGNGSYGQDYSQTDSLLMSQNQLLRQQNELLERLVKKEFGITKNEIGKAARDYSKEYFDRTGSAAYVF